jgi:hypothetical protein
MSRRSRFRRSLAFVAATAALTGLALPAQAHPSAHQPTHRGGPDPSTLPLGAAPKIAWQSGSTVHTASGRTVHLPLGKAGAGDQVLGKRDGSWIVVTPGYHAKVLAVKGNTVRTVWKHVYDESDTHYTLSRGGDLVVEWNFDRSGFTAVTVFDLRGKVVAQHSWTTSVYLLDFAGDTLLVSGRKTARWELPGKPVRVAPGATYGNLGSDLLFVDLPNDAVGPTPLSAPETPPWSATEWSPESVSTDGGYAAGLSFVSRLKLEVHKVSDGTLAPVPAFRADFDTPIAWEPDGSLLVEVKSSQGHALARCTMAGSCERVTPFVKGQALGFPV